MLREASVFQFAAAHSPLCYAVKWKTFMMQIQAGVINLCFADVEDALSPSPSISLPYLPLCPLPLSISLSPFPSLSLFSTPFHTEVPSLFLCAAASCYTHPGSLKNVGDAAQECE